MTLLNRMIDASPELCKAEMCCCRFWCRMGEDRKRQSAGGSDSFNAGGAHLRRGLSRKRAASTRRFDGTHDRALTQLNWATSAMKSAIGDTYIVSQEQWLAHCAPAERSKPGFAHKPLWNSTRCEPRKQPATIRPHQHP